MNSYKPVAGKGVTWGIVGMVFSGTILLLPIIFTYISGNVALPFVIVMGLLFCGLIGMFGYFTWAAKNMEYVLDDKELVIKWAFNNKVIPLDSIKGIERTIGTSSIKVVGASWPGFHIGSFTNPTGKGSVNLFATRIWGEIILIRTKWEVIGITPEDAEGFLNELNEKLPGINSERVENSEELPYYSAWKDKKFKIYMPFGIGIVTILMMFGINSISSRNNKASAYMLAAVSVFVAVVFALISIMMTITAG